VVPPEGGRDTIAAQCRIGNQDLGQWLVENGWARAAAGGPYVEAGNKARGDAKGIFGAPPDLSGLPAAPTPIEAQPEAASSILDLSGEGGANTAGASQNDSGPPASGPPASGSPNSGSIDSSGAVTPPVSQPAPAQ
jgi:hypothetical protein